MTQRFKDHREIIEAAGGPAIVRKFLIDSGRTFGKTIVYEWVTRNQIPLGYWDDIVALSKKFMEEEITLKQIFAARKGNQK